MRTLLVRDTLLGSRESFTFSAPLPPEECAERLSRRVRTDMRFWDRGRPLKGNVSSAGFFVRFWRNNRLPGDVRARGQFSPEPGGTRVDVTLDTNRAELMVLPLMFVLSMLVAAFVVRQLWFAALIALAIVAVYLRSRTVERSDRDQLATLIRDSLDTFGKP